ncbi:MAG TPA: radical SAM protein [Patescibacteria group bacterium]|nr:radical SAM protein [Patescibacteria group bacterium]
MIERNDSNKEDAHYRLLDNCRFVAGAKRGAIYDLNTGNVYSLDEAAKKVVKGDSGNDNFWIQLMDMGLATKGIASTIESQAETELPRVGLEFMWLELTERCNEKCLHCYASAGNSPKKEELSLTRWEQVLQEGASLGCRQVQFIGGEPLLVKGVFGLAKTAKDLGYNFVEIFTNGVLLTEDKIKKIKDLEMRVAVSLYSIIPEVHDLITKTPGSFRKTFTALEMLRKAQIPTRIGIIAMRQNESTLLETQRKLQEMGFDSTKIDVLRPTGRGGCGDLIPSQEVVNALALMTEPDFYTSREQFYRNQYWNSCWAGKIAITANGDVLPCIFARKHIVANVDQGLENAVNSPLLQTLWRTTKDQVETCRECEYRYACHDCRPLSEDSSSNFLGKNPRCMYDPLRGEW